MDTNSGNANSIPSTKVAHQMDVVEVPAMIAVETIFITDQLARQTKIQLSEALVLSEAYIQDDIEEDTDVCLIKAQDFGVMVQPDVEDFAGQTDGPNPQRDRETQTMKLSNQNNKDIAIQCDVETDIFFEDVHITDIDPLDVGHLGNNKSYEKFMEFVQENTNTYNDSKTECMKCGEVSKNSSQARSHMAIHWGPTLLCEMCGLCLEHVQLLPHECSFGRLNKNARKQIRFQQCPLYACGMLLKSNLKLLNHLEDHMRLATNQRLTPTKQRKLSLTKNIEVQPQSPNKRTLRGPIKNTLRCQICLIRSTCPSVFARHRKKCIKRFMQRQKFIKHKNMSSNIDKLLDLENI